MPVSSIYSRTLYALCTWRSLSNPELFSASPVYKPRHTVTSIHWGNNDTPYTPHELSVWNEMQRSKAAVCDKALPRYPAEARSRGRRVVFVIFTQESRVRSGSVCGSISEVNEKDNFLSVDCPKTEIQNMVRFQYLLLGLFWRRALGCQSHISRF